jgi:hypothetical protein
LFEQQQYNNANNIPYGDEIEEEEDLLEDDGKWFCIFSCHKKSEHWPQAEIEAEGADRIRVRRVISQSHLVKTMFMGVITQPNAERNFSELVSLKRSSEQQLLQRGTYCKRFHLDYQANRLIVNGSWHKLYDKLLLLLN